MESPLKKWQRIPVTVKIPVVYAVCSIIQKCISFFTVPFFTHLLTTEQYGQVIVYGSWYGIVSIFLTLNLSAGSFPTAMVKFEKDRAGYISSVQGITLYLTTLFLLIYLPFRERFNALFELPTPFVLMMIIEIMLVTATSMWTERKRFEYKYKQVVLLTMLQAIISPTLAYILVHKFEEMGYARIVGYEALPILLGAMFFIVNLVNGKKLFNKKYWEYALGFNIPLLAYYLSQVIFNQSDRIMISQMIGTDKAAVYGVAYSLAMVLLFVLSSINGSYIPWFYARLKEQNAEANKKVSLGIAVLMSILLCGVIWYSPEFVMFYGGEQYTEAVYAVPPVAVSVLLLFYAQLFINFEFFYERKKDLVWASIGSAIVNVVLNFLFIGRFGLVAAAYTTLISYVLFVICNYFAMRRILKEKQMEDNLLNYKGLIILFLFFCLVTAVGMLLYDWLIVRIIITVIVLLVMIIKRKYFLDIFLEIRKKK